MSRKTWKQKIGKLLMKHVAETTQNSTLREVKANLQSFDATGIVCFDCRRIAEKLSITTKARS